MPIGIVDAFVVAVGAQVNADELAALLDELLPSPLAVPSMGLPHNLPQGHGKNGDCCLQANDRDGFSCRGPAPTPRNSPNGRNCPGLFSRRNFEATDVFFGGGM